MLHILEVPNFKHILIHIGNTDDDTAGCLLVGDGQNNNLVSEARITKSTAAYKRIYPTIVEAIAQGDEAWIEYIDKIPSGGANASESLKNGIVRTERLNFRLEPGMHGHKLGVLNNGTEVKVMEEISGWYKVAIQGWVSGDYINDLDT